MQALVRCDDEIARLDAGAFDGWVRTGLGSRCSRIRRRDATACAASSRRRSRRPARTSTRPAAWAASPRSRTPTGSSKATCSIRRCLLPTGAARRTRRRSIASTTAGRGGAPRPPLHDEPHRARGDAGRRVRRGGNGHRRGHVRAGLIAAILIPRYAARSCRCAHRFPCAPSPSAVHGKRRPGRAADASRPTRTAA